MWLGNSLYMWSAREESVSKNSKAVNKRKNGMILLEDFFKNSRIVRTMEGELICKDRFHVRKIQILRLQRNIQVQKFTKY